VSTDAYGTEEGVNEASDGRPYCGCVSLETPGLQLLPQWRLSDFTTRKNTRCPPIVFINDILYPLHGTRGTYFDSFRGLSAPGTQFLDGVDNLEALDDFTEHDVSTV